VKARFEGSEKTDTFFAYHDGGALEEDDRPHLKEGGVVNALGKWQRLDSVGFESTRPDLTLDLAETVSGRKLLDDVRHACDSISKGFDFLRADFLRVDDKFYVGELTPYPGGGSHKWHGEPDMQQLLGDAWTADFCEPPLAKGSISSSSSSSSSSSAVKEVVSRHLWTYAPTMMI
jgi:hypothetical protein